MSDRIASCILHFCILTLSNNTTFLKIMPLIQLVNALWPLWPILDYFTRRHGIRCLWGSTFLCCFEEWLLGGAPHMNQVFIICSMWAQARICSAVYVFPCCSDSSLSLLNPSFSVAELCIWMTQQMSYPMIQWLEMYADVLVVVAWPFSCWSWPTDLCAFFHDGYYT